MIITFANHKGGVGKTSLATMMAENFINDGVKIKLYDLDEQQNFKKRIRDWCRDNPALANISVENKLPEKWPVGQIIIIDTPPAMTGNAVDRAIREADRVVIPTDCCVDSVAGIEFLLNKNKNLNVVVNRFRGGKIIKKTVRQKDKDGNIVIKTVTDFQGGRIKRDNMAYLFIEKMVENAKLKRDAVINLYCIPENISLRANLDDGNPWWHGISSENYKKLIKFATDIITGQINNTEG